MKYVLITGAAGFIGGYTVREFVEHGWHVFAMIHRKTSHDLERLARNGSVTIVRGDVTSFGDLKRLMERPGIRFDAVVHCAGRASDVGRRNVFRRTNFESVRHLVQLTQDLGVGRLVFVSTTDVYGLRNFAGETEDELPMDNNRRNPYPEFKIAAEKWIRDRLPDERFTIVRPGAVWGRGDPTLAPRIIAFLRWSPWILHFGSWRGHNRWPLAHVRNVAMALFLAATLPAAAGQAVNAIDSEVTTMDEFYRILADIYLPNKAFRSLTLPVWIGALFGAVVTTISNFFNMDKPFADPSLYALYSVTGNLDFSNRRFEELVAGANRSVVTREQGIKELTDDRATDG